MTGKKRSPFKWRTLSALILLFLILLTGQGIYAQEFTKEKVKEAGLVESEEGLKPSYSQGKYLGEMYMMVESLAANGDIIIEPIAVPLYKGDKLSYLFNYQMYAKTSPHDLFRKKIGNSETSRHKNYSLTKEDKSHTERKAKDLEENFIVNGLAQTTKKIIFQHPKLVEDYAKSKGINLAKLYHFEENERRLYLKDGTSTKNGRWEAYLDGEKITDSLSNYVAGENLQPGSTFILSYSPLGDDRGYQVPLENKIDLVKAFAKINSSGDKFLYLENSENKKTYEEAKEALADLLLDQNKAQDLAKKLDNFTFDEHQVKAYDNFAWYENHANAGGYVNDLLLSNLNYTIKPGQEMEIFALDIFRASSQNQNYQREDLKIEPIIGTDKVEIRKDIGDKTGVNGNIWPNIKDGASYFLRGLKEGLVKLKISYPTYNGRPTYMYVYITNRQTDTREGRPLMASNLDRFNKYDALYFTKDYPNYDLTLEVEKGAEPTVFANGQRVNLEKTGSENKNGQEVDAYKGSFPLQNFWTTVTFTVNKGGVKAARIYNLRSAYLEANLLGPSGETALREGDKAELHIKGLLAPKPKIGKFYNPSGAMTQFFTDLPGYGYVQSTGTTKVRLTKGGDINFFNGLVVSVAYGEDGFQETPRNQMPENKYLRKSVVSKMEDGLNRPQYLQEHLLIPDFHFNIRENSSYVPSDEGLIKAKTDKTSYRPGERVQVQIDISDQQIQDLNKLYDKYVVPENKGQNQHDGNTTAINYGYLIYTSKLPGLERLRTRPAVNNMTTDPDEKIKRLEKLRTLSFTIPETTPAGDYYFNGGYLQVLKGPIYGNRNEKHWMGQLGGFNLHVEGDPIIDKKPKLESFEMTEAEFIIPGTGNLEFNGNKLEATIRSKDQKFILKTKEPVDSIYMESTSPRGQFQGEYLTTEDNRTFISSKVPIKGEKNTLSFTIRKGQEQAIYTLHLTNLAGIQIQDKDPEELKELKGLLERAKKAQEANYTKEDWSALQEKIRKYQTMIELTDPTIDQLKTAYKDLEEALNKKKDGQDKPDDTNTEDLKILGLNDIHVEKGTSQARVLSLLPKTIVLIDQTGRGIETPVTWRLNNFQPSVPGVYTALGFYQDPYSKVNKLVERKIHLLENKDNKGLNQVDKEEYLASLTKEIQVGQDLDLPDTIEITRSQGQVQKEQVYWYKDKVNTEKPGTYKVKGILLSTGEEVEMNVKIIEGDQAGSNQPHDPIKDIVSIPTKIASNKKYGSGSKFLDISGHWAEDVINKCVDAGLFQGVDDQHFAPNRPVTQGELITLLGRMAGVKKATEYGPYYSVYRDWAQEQGILKGKSFQANKVLTREEMADLIYRAYQVMGQDLSPKKDISLKDRAKISKAYRKAVDNLVKAGHLRGDEKMHFNPKSNFTRAQLAQVLWNSYEK